MMVSMNNVTTEQREQIKAFVLAQGKQTLLEIGND